MAALYLAVDNLNSKIIWATAVGERNHVLVFPEFRNNNTCTCLLN